MYTTTFPYSSLLLWHFCRHKISKQWPLHHDISFSKSSFFSNLVSNQAVPIPRGKMKRFNKPPLHTPSLALRCRIGIWKSNKSLDFLARPMLPVLAPIRGHIHEDMFQVWNCFCGHGNPWGNTLRFGLIECHLFESLLALFPFFYYVDGQSYIQNPRTEK